MINRRRIRILQFIILGIITKLTKFYLYFEWFFNPLVNKNFNLHLLEYILEKRYVNKMVLEWPPPKFIFKLLNLSFVEIYKYLFLFIIGYTYLSTVISNYKWNVSYQNLVVWIKLTRCDISSCTGISFREGAMKMIIRTISHEMKMYQYMNNFLKSQNDIQFFFSYQKYAVSRSIWVYYIDATGRNVGAFGSCGGIIIWGWSAPHSYECMNKANGGHYAQLWHVDVVH